MTENNSLKETNNPDLQATPNPTSTITMAQDDMTDDVRFPDAQIQGEEAQPEKTGAAAEVLRVPRDTINYFVLAILFLGLGIFLGMNIGGNSVDAEALREVIREEVQANSDAQFAQLQELVLSVASNGELDSEALQALIQSAVEEASIQQVDYMDDDDPYIGPEDAPVVIVEFSDFLCTFCGRHYQQTLTPIIENYEGLVRYVYRDFPGVGGENAVSSALAAECANDQGKFWEYHNVLFENTQAISVSLDQLETVLIGFAGDLDLNVEEFTSCLTDGTHIADIFQDRMDAQNVGARGTPAFLINGVFVSGAQPYEIFASIIDAELEEAGIERPS